MNLEVGVALITGMGVGIEFPNTSDIAEDLKFCMVVDLLVFRFMFNIWKEAE